MCVPRLNEIRECVLSYVMEVKPLHPLRSSLDIIKTSIFISEYLSHFFMVFYATNKSRSAVNNTRVGYTEVSVDNQMLLTFIIHGKVAPLYTKNISSYVYDTIEPSVYDISPHMGHIQGAVDHEMIKEYKNYK